MGKYQKFRGNPENKLLYVVDDLIGGINTDFSDDSSPDNEFKSIVNDNEEIINILTTITRTTRENLKK